MDVEGAQLKRSAWRVVFAYAAGIVAGVTVAVLASATGATDNIYVMFAVLLVVMAALLGGTGPAIGRDHGCRRRRPRAIRPAASARAVERRSHFRHDCHHRRPARLSQA